LYKRYVIKQFVTLILTPGSAGTAGVYALMHQSLACINTVWNKIWEWMGFFSWWQKIHLFRQHHVRLKYNKCV